MRLAFSANAFRRYSLADTIRVIGELGYDGIEIMADRPHAWPADLDEAGIEAIRRQLDEAGLAVSNVNGFMTHAIGDTWHPSWIEADPGLRKARIDHTIGCVHLAAALGCGTVSTEPGGPLAGMGREAALEIFAAGLEILRPHLEETGVRLLIEPEPELLIEHSFAFTEFFEKFRLDPELYGLNFDMGHFFCVGEDPAPLIADLAPYTGHYHLEDIAADRVHHHLLPGDGAMDFSGIFAALRATGYTKYVTVELYPYEDDPVATARLARERLAPYLAS